MAKDSPIQFKGTTLKIIQTQLRTIDTRALHAALGELTGNAPDFFEHELAVLDFSSADELNEAADWPAIIALFRQSGLQPVATRGLPDELAAAAAAAGLPAVAADALPNRPPRAKAETPAPAEAVVEPAPAVVAEPAPPPVAPPPPPSAASLARETA